VDNRRNLPALILIYTGIDICSWLNRPVNKQDVTRDDFIFWTDTYLSPVEKVKCTAIDLYAARCSLVHSYTAVSHLTRGNKAKQAVYAWGNKGTQPLQALFDISTSPNFVVIHIDALFSAFKNGVERFLFDIEQDASLRLRVLERNKQIFLNQSWP
jgi:hypothetical protein